MKSPQIHNDLSNVARLLFFFIKRKSCFYCSAVRFPGCTNGLLQSCRGHTGGAVPEVEPSRPHVVISVGLILLTLEKGQVLSNSSERTENIELPPQIQPLNAAFWAEMLLHPRLHQLIAQLMLRPVAWLRSSKQTLHLGRRLFLFQLLFQFLINVVPGVNAGQSGRSALLLGDIPGSKRVKNSTLTGQ